MKLYFNIRGRWAELCLKACEFCLLLLMLALMTGMANADELLMEKGKKLFSRQCANCHEVGLEAKNKVGPHLDQVFGRVAGSVEGFRYSKSMKNAGEGGLVWDHETIGRYLEKPREMIKGTRMSYRGMSDENERAALLSWLADNSKSPELSTQDQSSTIEDEETAKAVSQILALEGDAAYGEYLSGDCVTCHQISGQVEGIPSIVGIPEDYFIKALIEYKAGVRENEVMKTRVTNLTDEELAALAAYFGGLQPQ